MSRHVHSALPPLAGAAWLLAATFAQAAPPPPSATAPGPDAYRTMPVRPVDPQWRVTAVPYLWFASVKSSVAFTPPVGSRSTIDATFDASFGDVLSAFKFGFMGAAEARRGRFSAQTDFIYLSLAQSGSHVRDVTGPLGREFPVSVGGELKPKTTLWTLSGGYDVFRNERNFVQLFAGFRYLGSDNTLDWSFQGPVADLPRTGTRSASDNIWDGIAGVRGESALGASRWKLVYYGDVGTGGSKLTWQASGQLAYTYFWGDIGIGWRYMDYQPHDGGVLQNLTMSGPILVAHYRFGS